MRITKASVARRVGRERALSTLVRSDSPLEGAETDWFVTVLRPEGLVFFVGVAPKKEYGDYQRTLEAMINSVQFVNK